MIIRKGAADNSIHPSNKFHGDERWGHPVISTHLQSFYLVHDILALANNNEGYTGEAANLAYEVKAVQGWCSFASLRNVKHNDVWSFSMYELQAFPGFIGVD